MASATGSASTGCRLRLCAGGGVLHSWSSDSVDSSLASVGLGMTDAANVDGATAVAAKAVVG